MKLSTLNLSVNTKHNRPVKIQISGTPEPHMKWGGGGGLMEVLKLAIRVDRCFLKKNFVFHTAVMAGIAFKNCWPHREQELKLH